jgi:hypothetical protein
MKQLLSQHLRALCLRVLVVGALIASGTLIVGGSAQAADCGSNWWPANGSQTVQWSGDDVIIRTMFSFTDENIKAYRCTDSSAFEVDHLLYSGIAPGSGTLSRSSNLPDSYNDTEFDDEYPPRTLTVGSQSAKKLQANTEYFVEIRVTDATLNNSLLQLNLNFQRSHWAKKLGNPKQVAIEQTSCRSHGGSDPAWCVFASDTERMAQDAHVGPLKVSSTPEGIFAVLSWGAGSSSPAIPQF